jgi:hypothetical protein
MKLARTAVLAALAATGASAQTNLGAQKAQASLPFVITQVATFNLPWRLAFLPDGWERSQVALEIAKVLKIGWAWSIGCWKSADPGTGAMRPERRHRQNAGQTLSTVAARTAWPPATPT